MTFIEHCKKHHSLPDVCCPKIGLELEFNDVVTLWGMLQHQYVSYTHPENIQVVRKIRDFVTEHGE